MGKLEYWFSLIGALISIKIIGMSPYPVEAVIFSIPML